MKLRAEIKQQAKENLSSQYGISIGALVVYAILAWAASAFTAGIGTFFAAPPLIVGYVFFCLHVYRNEQTDISDMFNTGFGDYWRSVGGILWMWLFTWLWSLLFIIPGIIKALSYFMTPYILAESKNVSATEALKLSMRMTKGYKGEIFVMYLSYIGWMLLSGLTAGILYILYVGPYMNTALAGLYDELKKNALTRGVVTAEELA